MTIQIKGFLFFIFSFHFIPIQGWAGGRTLMVISELDHRGMKELAPLYKQIEALAWSIPSQLESINSIYSQKILLRNQDATSKGVQEELLNTLESSDVETVDVILGVHGMPGKILFFDGAVVIKDWVEELKGKIINTLGEEALNKFGFIYNLSCFGESHIESFLNLGFKVAIGSRQVNANAELEYPFVLKLLSLGATVDRAFALPNSESWLKFADNPIRWLGEKQNSFMKDTDSFKVIGGNKNYRIYNYNR